MTTSADAVGSPGPSGWTDTHVRVRLTRGAGGAVRVDGVLCSAPVWIRWDGATLWLVGSGASPVGEDHIRVRVDVGPGVEVALRSVAATLVYAARGSGTRWDTEIHVASGASLDWRPEPVILTAQAVHATTTTVFAEAGARVALDEVLVLGRSGESTGTLRSTLSVHMADRPVLLTSMDTSIPGWSGPAGVQGASVVATRLEIADHDLDAGDRSTPQVAVLEPDPRCLLAVAVGSDVAAVCGEIDAALPL